MLLKEYIQKIIQEMTDEELKAHPAYISPEKAKYVKSLFEQFKEKFGDEYIEKVIGGKKQYIRDIDSIKLRVVDDFYSSSRYPSRMLQLKLNYYSHYSSYLRNILLLIYNYEFHMKNKISIEHPDSDEARPYVRLTISDFETAISVADSLEEFFALAKRLEDNNEY